MLYYLWISTMAKTRKDVGRFGMLKIPILNPFYQAMPIGYHLENTPGSTHLIQANYLIWRYSLYLNQGF